MALAALGLRLDTERILRSDHAAQLSTKPHFRAQSVILALASENILVSEPVVTLWPWADRAV
jgi:hypothetical protein